jgi:hypothetical protein
MWGNWIRRANPTSRTATLTQVNIVPGALLYINLPSLLLAARQKDAVEVGRLHIAIVLWGTIASISLISTYITIFRAYRQIRRSEKLKA